jgi:SNF2 family DNA or RNA helicase
VSIEAESVASELSDIDRLLNEYMMGEAETAIKEAEYNSKIEELRREIARLRDVKTAIKRNRILAEKRKESLARKLQLEREAELIQRTIEERRAEVEDIIRDAPWRHDAFDWQINGAVQLPDRGLLGDKRGLGKTLSSLIWRRTHGCKRTLVCLRKEVAPDFIKEIGIREPGLFVYPMLGTNSQGREIAAMLLNHQKEFIVVTNIESWRRNIEDTIGDILKIDYDSIILDEAHHIKNSATGTAQGFFKLAASIPKVLELTGTPIKNRPQEMYSLLHALYPDIFPRESLFIADYCTMITQNKYVFTPIGLKSLVARISSFYVARSPEDIGRLVPPPKMIEYKLDFESHPEQKEAYKVMTERSMAILGTGKVIPIISQLAIMTRQAQVVSWPAGINFEIKDEEGQVIEIVKFDVHQSVKMDWAEDLIKELVEEGERIILFSRFKPAIYELRRRLTEAGLSVAVITGDEKAKGNTEEVFNDFDLKTAPENPKYQVLLATYQTVGESANLNAARHMVLYDRFWNPGNEDQAVGRIDRINSIDQATVHIPVVDNSIDVYMGKLIEEKRTIVTDFKSASSQQTSLLQHLKESL